jgi:hypothetical protein
VNLAGARLRLYLTGQEPPEYQRGPDLNVSDRIAQRMHGAEAER